jgi:hypothetical protein
MTKELKVYNRFNELILYLRLAPEHLFPLQVVLGSRELRQAVRGLYGQDFDRTVVVDGQHRRFVASWASSEYLDALAGYWESNFRWRTEKRRDEVAIEAKSSPLDLSIRSLGLSGGVINQAALAGSLTNPYSSGLVTQSSLQTELVTYLSPLGTYNFEYAATSPTVYREPHGLLPHQALAVAILNTVGIPEPSDESNFGMATEAAPQGGSPYGATVSAPG